MMKQNLRISSNKNSKFEFTESQALYRWFRGCHGATVGWRPSLGGWEAFRPTERVGGPHMVTIFTISLFKRQPYTIRPV